PMLSQAYGGVKLKVPEPKVERAREILADERDGALEDDAADIEDEDYEPLSEEEKEQWEEVARGLHCPECGSESVGLDPVYLWGWMAVTLGAFLSWPVWPASLANGHIVTGMTLLVVGKFLFILRKVPLACKECHHGGSRAAFDPSTELADGG
ncbi:MAG: hypothetical protein ABEN55_01180, partial [Bradymonadaceae bacterium]